MDYHKFKLQAIEGLNLGSGEQYFIPPTEEGLNYSDLYLIPNQGIVKSRSECDTSVTLGKLTFDIPVVPANMKSVVDKEFCLYLAKRNTFYIMHRFGVNLIEFYDYMRKYNQFVSISIGVKEESLLEYAKLVSSNRIPEYVTIDIAHGDSIAMKETIEFVKGLTPNVFLIAGNVATGEAVLRLESWGADATKVGIANGSGCATYNATGVGRPQHTTNIECCRVAKKPVISDGSVKEVGDIVKALWAGATMVMAGKMFAGFDQSSGDIIEIDGEFYKEYYGSASAENKGKHEHVEGRKLLVEYKGDASVLLKDIKDGVSSAISYAGGTKIEDISRMRLGIKR